MTWSIWQDFLAESISKSLGNVRHVSFMYIEVTLSCNPWVLQRLRCAEPTEGKSKRSDTIFNAQRCDRPKIMETQYTYDQEVCLYWDEELVFIYQDLSKARK